MPPRARQLAALIAVTALLASSAVVAKGAFWSTKSLLKSFFKDSEKVSYVEVQGHELERVLGEKPTRGKYVVFVASSGDRVDGYAVVDDEKGQHEPITFGTKLSPDGRVARAEVMAYREGYGEEIREARFRRQFEGKSVSDPMRFGSDIDGISGATISSKSMTKAVKRAIALAHIAKRKHEKLASGAGAGSKAAGNASE